MIAPPRYGVEPCPPTCACRPLSVRRSRLCGRPSAKWTPKRAGTSRPRLGTRSPSWFFCSTYAGAIAGVRVNEDGFIVVTAGVPGNDAVAVTIAVGPEATCARRVSTADGHFASAAPDARSFEHVLANRLRRVGVQRRGGTVRG